MVQKPPQVHTDHTERWHLSHTRDCPQLWNQCTGFMYSESTTECMCAYITDLWWCVTNKVLPRLRCLGPAQPSSAHHSPHTSPTDKYLESQQSMYVLKQLCVYVRMYMCVKCFGSFTQKYVPGHTAPLVKNCRWNGLLLQCIYHSTPQGTYLDTGSTVSAIHTLAH